ncbi:MAG TPA: hypothetical protein VGK91_03690 [Candidatus Udaeobacter sp.]|jgi:hypothetical protein
MKYCLPSLVLILTLSASVVLRADTDAEVSARKDALELAGAFGNDGFKIRDGHSCGVLKAHDHALIAVNLYAGNQYWFSVGTTEPLKKVAVSLYDEIGNQMTTENFSEGDKAAAGFAPENSGQYFVSVDSVGDQEGSFCLVYSYK